LLDLNASTVAPDAGGALAASGFDRNSMSGVAHVDRRLDIAPAPANRWTQALDGLKRRQPPFGRPTHSLRRTPQMSASIRRRLVAGAGLLLVLVIAGTWQQLGSAQADRNPADALSRPATDAAPQDLVLGRTDAKQPATMEQFLTAVTKDVDTYWTEVFEASGLAVPRVTYNWIPAGQTAASACGDASGTLGDSAAAYCMADDTIYISQQFASDIYTGALDDALPGSSQGYGRTIGDFSVAYIVAHEYGHQIQDELGLFQQYGAALPTAGFELQADCYAGTWAASAYQENRLEEGDLQEALDAAMAVGDFNAGSPGHHGTPEQREAAWYSGFQSGDPAGCSEYLQA
jgi:predicted metalloprotease